MNEADRAALLASAGRLGTAPLNLATVISYETGGIFDPGNSTVYAPVDADASMQANARLYGAHAPGFVTDPSSSRSHGVLIAPAPDRGGGPRAGSQPQLRVTASNIRSPRPNGSAAPS